jgi:SecD/SecF fusion protein
LDSIEKSVFNLGFTQFTFNEVSDKQIKRSRFRGGINVILQISVKDILKGLSNNSKNPVFNKSIADATANLQGNSLYIDKFLKL